ncbi:MAG: CPBP family intramembrane metalloprotease [Deinococcales bacterium]
MTEADAPPRSPRAFFALTVALLIPFWALGFAAHVPGLPMNLPLSALGTFCPLIAAIILTRRQGGPGHVRRLLRRILDVGAIPRKRWLAPIVLLMPAVMTLSYLAMRAMGKTLPEPHIHALAVPALLLAYLAAAAGEEVGWTAYATDALQARHGALTTALIVGAVWAAIHVIGFWQAHPSVPWIAWQCLVTLTLRIIMVWLYHHSGRSLFGIILFHATINLSVSLFPIGGSHYDPAVTAVILMAIATTLILLDRPMRLPRPAPQ